MFAYTPLGQRISGCGHGERAYAVTYFDGRGVLRQLLAAYGSAAVTVVLALDGTSTAEAAATLGHIDGVITVEPAELEEDD